MIETVLAVAVMIYGVAGALASLLQLRRIRDRGSSQDISLAYLAVYGAGYVLWLAYGIVIHSIPLIVADAVGAAAMAVTICVATRLRVGVHCIGFVRAHLRRGTGGSASVEALLAEELEAPAAQSPARNSPAPPSPSANRSTHVQRRVVRPISETEQRAPTQSRPLS